MVSIYFIIAVFTIAFDMSYVVLSGCNGVVRLLTINKYFLSNRFKVIFSVIFGVLMLIGVLWRRGFLF